MHPIVLIKLLLPLTWNTWPKLPSPMFEPMLKIASLGICFPLLLRASQRDTKAVFLPREVRDKIGFASKGLGRKTSGGRPMEIEPIANLGAIKNRPAL